MYPRVSAYVRGVFREEATSALDMVFMWVLHLGRIGILSVGLAMRGKPETPEKSLSARRETTINSIYRWHRVGIQPEPHWWKASALTTAPSLLRKAFSKNIRLLNITKQYQSTHTDVYDS